MLHQDLLAQSRLLAGLDPAAPKQADLRRAVSSAYYAVFHFFIHETVEHFATGLPPDAASRVAIARAFVHGSMRAACNCFSSDQERRRKGKRRTAAPLGAAAAAPAASAVPITGPSSTTAPTDREAEIPCVGAIVIPGDLQQVADSFIHLQEARHRADYNLVDDFAKSEVEALILEGEGAIAGWAAFRGTSLGHLFLTVLLLHTNLEKNRGSSG
jgi:hypothetical protein